MDKTLAPKFPFSVATVILLYPAPGGPDTGAGVAGFGVGAFVGVDVGLGVDDEVGEGCGDAVGVTVLTVSINSEACGLVFFTPIPRNFGNNITIRIRAAIRMGINIEIKPCFKLADI